MINIQKKLIISYCEKLSLFYGVLELVSATKFIEQFKSKHQKNKASKPWLYIKINIIAIVKRFCELSLSSNDRNQWFNAQVGHQNTPKQLSFALFFLVMIISYPGILTFDQQCLH